MVHRRPRARSDGDVTGRGRVAGRLKQGRVHDPGERPRPRVDHVQPTGDLAAGRAQQRPGSLDRSGRKEHAVTGFRAYVHCQPGPLGVGEILGHRPTERAVVIDEDIGQAAMSALLGPVLPAVQGPTGLRCAAGHHHRPDVGRLEYPKRRGGEVLGAFDEFEAESQIRFIGAEPAHRVGVGHPRDGQRQFIADQRPQRGQHLLCDGDHVIGVDEAHLHVELGELRLAVGAEVLVAVAPRDLVVTLHPADHEQLLEQLRALRQRVKRAGLQAGRHQEVARPFGGGSGERWRLDLDEIMAGQHRPGGGVDPRPQTQRVAWATVAPHIQVAVPQSGLLAGRFVELERQCRALPQHRQRGRVDFDVSGDDIGVRVAFRADLDHPGDDDAVLRAQSVGAVEHVGIAEHDLGDPRGVAEVDEDHPTVVAAPGHPARQGYLLAGVGGPQRTGGMTAQH